MKPAIALFQPDIAGNTGAIIRLASCLDCDLHIIEPMGFTLNDKNLRRAGMDYVHLAKLRRHIDWDNFYSYITEDNKRLVLFTTKSTRSYYNFTYSENDILLFGRESAGVPNYVHNIIKEQLTIP